MSYYLIDANLNRMKTEISKHPRRLPRLQIEALRCAGTVGKSNLQELTKAGDSSARFKEVVADDVQGHYEMYKRIRAFFNSLCWLCISFPAWFGYQDVVFICDKMLDLLNYTHNGRRPPMAHFTQAWFQTVCVLADIVQQTRCNLGDAFRQTGNWLHLWTFYSSSSATGDGTGKGSVLPDAPSDIQKALNKQMLMNRQLQSQNDRTANELKKLRQQKGQGNNSYEDDNAGALRGALKRRRNNKGGGKGGDKGGR